VSIPAGLSDWTGVSVNVGPAIMQPRLAMTSTSVKLDVINGRVLASFTDMVLGAGARRAAPRSG
jgi:hypothetical protein